MHCHSRLKKSNKMQQYADIYLQLNYSTCFGRPLRPSSGVHKTVVATSGTDTSVRCEWCHARHHPYRTHDLRSGSQDHHPSKNSAQKTICRNSTSNAPDDGRTYPKHVELRIHQ